MDKGKKWGLALLNAQALSGRQSEEGFGRSEGSMIYDIEKD